ncbi:MAG: FkbM family methyltransferase [Mycobacterium sp.]
MRVLRSIRYNAKEARDMGFPYAARRLVSRSSPMVRVPIKGVGPLTLRLGSSDEPTVRQIFVDGQYDMRCIPQWRDIERRYEEILHHGRRPLIVDAGANIGAASLYFAREFPRAKIVAVEPEPSNARLCCENTSAFDVEVLPMAIGSARGKVSLVDEDCENWAFATRRSSDGDIAVCTINDIVTNHHGECDLFLVKIDIEGFESDLFSANVEWVRDAKIIFIEPHDWLLPGQATSRNFQRVLAEHEFDVIVSGENLLYVRR